MPFLVSVMKTVVEITSEILDINRYLCLFVFLILLVLATILLDSGIIGICKTIILAAVITVAVATIVYVFSVYHASELLDLYRKSNIPTDTSRYLNILYYKGKLVEVTDVISMLAVGIGCIGMPLMYKGVINIRDVKRLDRSGICAVVFERLGDIKYQYCGTSCGCQLFILLNWRKLKIHLIFIICCINPYYPVKNMHSL